MSEEKSFDCIILGGGPAGLSAALYCRRANLNCAIVDLSAIGGTPSNYCEIENYLGFDKINGWELCERFEEHVDRFEVQKFPYEEIQNIDLSGSIKKIKTLENEFCSKSIIIATGAKPRKLGIKGEKEFFGKGVSYCAVCDGAFYKDKVVVVIGGGNSALEEALYLTRFAKKVYLIHRRSEFRADEIIQRRVFENKKIELILNSIPVEINGNSVVEELLIQDVQTKKISALKTDGIFPYIGIEPNSEMFSGQVEQDKQGFIVTDNSMKTSTNGVWAIGDIRNTPLRQVITAVSDGAVAGVSVSRYLMNLKEEDKVMEQKWKRLYIMTV